MRLFLAPRSPPFTLATPFFNSFFRVHINLSINCVADVSESTFCLKSWREKTAKTLLLTSCVRIIQEFIIKYTEYLWGFASFCSLVHLVDCSALLFDCCSTFIEILTNETNEKKQHEKSVDDKRVDKDTKWGEKRKKVLTFAVYLLHDRREHTRIHNGHDPDQIIIHKLKIQLSKSSHSKWCNYNKISIICFVLINYTA